MSTVYVAFLRGINVGGHNIVPKVELLKVFVSQGYQNVLVYKQSGNVIFQTDQTNEEVIRKGIQKELHALLGKDIDVFLRSLSYLQELVKSNPFENVDSKNASFLVTFFPIDPAPSTPAFPIKIPKTNAEIIKFNKTEAYSVTRGFGEGGKPNLFLEKTLKTKATTRNWNIIKEIVQPTQNKK